MPTSARIDSWQGARCAHSVDDQRAVVGTLLGGALGRSVLDGARTRLQWAAPNCSSVATLMLILAQSTASVGEHPQQRERSSADITSIVTDRLCGSIPITTRSLLAVRCSFDTLQLNGSRGHRCYELSNPFLSHSDPAVTGTAQALRDPHNRWSADERATVPDNLDRDSSEPGRAVNGTSSR